MAKQRPSKWSAFWLSLLAPGSGQLLTGSATSLAWFAAAAIATVVFTPRELDSSKTWIYCLALPLWFGLCLTSAWHARGLLERQMPWPASHAARPKVNCRTGLGRAIKATIRVKTSLSPAELWRRVSDLQNFLVIDPFHESITLMRAVPAAGVDVVLHHDAFGKRFDRFGRILWWRQGEGFAVSDLSARDPLRGFPHVFTYRVETDNNQTATLSVEVTGRWTSRWIPTWLGRLWIQCVCRYHAKLLASAL